MPTDSKSVSNLMLLSVPQLQRIPIFIASPSDVADARERIRHAVDRINILLAKREGFLLEAVGWEDIPSGRAARPQEVINPYVDAAHIFICVLHQRFGQPTGLADSGTEEEFRRMKQRWDTETPKPSMLAYFKTPSAEANAEEMQKVSRFKQEVSAAGIFYKDFLNEDALQQEVENALADWVYERIGTHVNVSAASSALLDRLLNDTDLKIISYLTDKTAKADMISQELSIPQTETDVALSKLREHGLVTMIDEICKPSESNESSITISKYLLVQKYYFKFMESTYFRSMLDRQLRGILLVRQHYSPDESNLKVLKILLNLSPRATAFILHGDTTKFDNLSAQLSQDNISPEIRTQGLEILSQMINQQAVICAINDMTEGKLLRKIDNRELDGMVLRAQLSAASHEGLVFQNLIVLPMMVAKAAGTIQAGQMVSGSAELIMNQGTLLFYMGEHDLAIHQFDKVLSMNNITDDVRAGALNNKGLALYNLSKTRRAEAEKLIREALKLNPKLTNAKNNLELVKAKSFLQKIRSLLRP